MPKYKETTVPLKGEKPRKAPKLSDTARKAPPKSEEIVVESDSEGSHSSSSSGHSSGSEEDAERRKNTKKPKLSKVAETEPADPPVPDSTSEDEDSSEDESESDDEEDGANGLPDPEKVPQIEGKKKSTAKVRENKDESSEVSDSSEDEAAAPKGTQHATSTVRPTRDFRPPPGYSEFSYKDSTNSTESNFNSSNIASKQIWHITAPAGLSLAQITSLALGSLDGKQVVCSHKGVDYGMTEEKQTSGESVAHANKHVFIPSNGGNGYSTVKTPVTRTLHLQQIINLPNLSKKQADPDKGSNAAAETGQQHTRGPKPQPKGLKMRYKPPGFGFGRPGPIGSDSSEEDEDVEMADAAPLEFTLPGNKSKADSGKKRKAAEMTDKTQKSDKKQRKDKAKSTANGQADRPMQSEQDEPHVVTKAEKALVQGTKVEAPVGQDEGARLTAEKEQRKEERRLKRERKEQRRKAAEGAAA